METPHPSRRAILRGLASLSGAPGGPQGFAVAAATPELPALLPSMQPAILEFALAGAQHHALHRLRVRPLPGAVLRLVREPDNQHDPNAVSVQLTDGTRLGYVPRSLAALLAGLMDFGCTAEAQVVGPAHADQLDDPALPPLLFSSFLNGDPRLALVLGPPPPPGQLQAPAEGAPDPEPEVSAAEEYPAEPEESEVDDSGGADGAGAAGFWFGEAAYPSP